MLEIYHQINALLLGLFRPLAKHSDEKQFLYLNNKALNFNPKKAPNSQNLPNIVKLNFAINIIPKKTMMKKNFPYSKNLNVRTNL